MQVTCRNIWKGATIAAKPPDVEGREFRTTIDHGTNARTAEPHRQQDLVLYVANTDPALRPSRNRRHNFSETRWA